MIKELQQNNVTIFVVSGQVAPEDIIEFMNSRYDEDKPISNDVIWNLDDAKMSNRKTEDIHKLAEFLKDFDKWGSRKGGRTAYVASDDLNYGLLKMYASYVQDEKLEVCVDVFRTNEDAIVWFNDGYCLGGVHIFRSVVFQKTP